MKKLSLLMLVAFLTACVSATNNLPPNLETEAGAGGGQYIRHVYFDYTSNEPTGLELAKQCIAVNVDNRTQVITDSSSSWVGPYTKNYYQHGSTTAVAGGQVVESVSKTLNSIVASGNMPYSIGLTNDLLRFKLILSLGEKGARISFINIQRAQQSTGLLTNDGFSPVGVWLGSRYESAYEAIDKKASALAQCMNLTKI